MNIAHCVESYTPAVGGMVEVVRQLSERMARMGHRVTVFTSAHIDRRGDEFNGVHVRSFNVSGNAVEGLHGEHSAYVDALRDGDFDVVVFFAAQQWATDSVLPRLAEIRAKKVLVPTGFSALHDPRWNSYYGSMPAWMRSMDLNIFHTEAYQDILFAREHGVEKCSLIPNGASSEEFDQPASYDLRSALGLRPGTHVVLHVGSYTGIKGHKEALRIFSRADTADAVLLFIGNGVKALERQFNTHWRFLTLRWRLKRSARRVLFQEFDREGTVNAMKQADLFLFPSQVECSPIVLFETVAAGVPFLASRAGNSEEIARWTQGGWTIPGRPDENYRTHVDAKKGAALLSHLLRDTPRLKAAGATGQAAWRDRFTWQRIAEQYTAAYTRLLP